MDSVGRQATFERLIAEYAPALQRLTGCYETDSAGREDLFQDIALGLWEAIPNFRHASSERTWVYRIAHNIAITAMVKRYRRDRREVTLTEDAASTSVGALPDSDILLEEQRKLMLAAIRGLPADDRQIIALHLEGLGYQEIEEVSGLSQSAIATRLSRIRDRLREAVRKKEVRK